MTKVSDEDEKTMELRACCSADVNKLLFDFVGPATLNTATESSLLAHIKSVSVKACIKTCIGWHSSRYGKRTTNQSLSMLPAYKRRRHYVISQSHAPQPGARE